MPVTTRIFVYFQDRGSKFLGGGTSNPTFSTFGSNLKAKLVEIVHAAATIVPAHKEPVVPSPPKRLGWMLVGPLFWGQNRNENDSLVG